MRRTPGSNGLALDVNDQFPTEAGRQLEELTGHNVFEVFPKMPADLGDTERTVLAEAFDTGRRALSRKH